MSIYLLKICNISLFSTIFKNVSNAKYRATEIRLKVATNHKFPNVGKRDKIVSVIKATPNDNARGSKISLNIRSFAPLTEHSRFTFKKQVRKFEKYIIPIKPLSPVRGSTIRIRIIRTVESLIAVRKVKDCWSRPFKMPSEILSRYIKGTIGERATRRAPTSLEL